MRQQKNNIKKIYLVYREVVASSFIDAIRQKGEIYQVSLADDNSQLKLLGKKNKVGYKKQ